MSDLLRRRRWRRASVENWRAREGCFSLSLPLPEQRRDAKKVAGARGREKTPRRTEPEGAMAFRVETLERSRRERE